MNNIEDSAPDYENILWNYGILKDNSFKQEKIKYFEGCYDQLGDGISRSSADEEISKAYM